VLAGNRTYFWRARTVNGETLGDWVTAVFSTRTQVPAAPIVRRQERVAGQFRRDVLDRTAATDSGLTIAPGAPLQLWSRSYGDRGGIAHHVYSRIGVNNQVIWGYEWEVGQSYMGIRVNEYDGSYLFKTFDVKNGPQRADSLKDFIEATPNGNYVVLSVIFDGHTNVTENLMQAIESMGSRQIRALTPGQAWAFIGRKGYPGDALEQRTDDSAIVSLQVPNYYSLGSGTVTTPFLPVPSSWIGFHWKGSINPGVTAIRIAVLGMKASGAVDTLAIIPSDSTDVSLAFLNGSRAAYAGYRFQALLSTGDALRTPIIEEWWYDAELPGDVAISAQTVGLEAVSVARGTDIHLPVTVYNLGYQRVDSSTITLQLYDERNSLRPLATAGVGRIAADSSRTIGMQIPTQSLPANTSLRVQVSPVSVREDLCADNNDADVGFSVTGASPARIQLLSDGIPLMDGDYIAASPKLVVHLANVESLGPMRQGVELFVDNVSVMAQEGTEPTFLPSLAPGKHPLRVVARMSNSLGYVDSVQRELLLNVVNEYRILQLFNYPNPFAGETFVSFVLTGARPPEQGSVRIYTVAGRKIRDMALPSSALQIGVNKVFWDGRDNDGDEVANGLYFYQVEIRTGEKTEVVTGKMVRVR
jgi:hypothetical protein